MLKLMTFDLPYNPSQDTCFLDLVWDALEATHRIPEETPDLGLGDHYVRENLAHLTVENMPNGWVANITFKPRSNQPENCLTSPVHAPLPTAAEALIHGAAIVSDLVSGSAELPFIVVGNRLMVAAYGPPNAA
ncbi:hypothetical protein FIU97_19400 (plasmid) [Roseivivax sp. THAF40]|uniref:hypothetical protein n=1 Tax=unclassified Roseivivax TaxID=2639302 RepID=UPI0012691B6C|nr:MULTISPECIES: hypothetical protein [unclassified Roseivivax]QFS84860.1 hypothetical protein FIV09_18615 [Roseivivax sp. THAF197b]QFT48762.1 hypothetical protein FIU97_19400 [Roseivivax sp. THAF40]